MPQKTKGGRRERARFLLRVTTRPAPTIYPEDGELVLPPYALRELKIHGGQMFILIERPGARAGRQELALHNIRR